MSFVYVRLPHPASPDERTTAHADYPGPDSVTEPITEGLVVLHTSLGDILIELWRRECPKAVRKYASQLSPLPCFCTNNLDATALFNSVSKVRSWRIDGSPAIATDSVSSRPLRRSAFPPHRAGLHRADWWFRRVCLR